MMLHTSRKAKRTLLLPLSILAVLILAAVVSGNGDEHDEGSAGDGYPDSLLSRLNDDYASVRHIMATSCYDCHSQKTDYPWYHALPVAKQFLDGHIKHAREELDMTNDFPFKGEHGLKAALNDIKKEIYEDEMPLLSYRLMHWGTEVTGERRDSLFAWIDSALNALKQYEQTSAMQATPAASPDSD